MELISLRAKHLANVGRLQYFYHSPSSELPIRDVRNELGDGFKTEPHIENGSENFLKPCYQKHIRSHALGVERFLFLYTRVRSREMEFFGKRLVVGYIDKKNAGTHSVCGKELIFSQGKAKLVSFSNGVPVEEVGVYGHLRGTKILSEEQTEYLLDHFRGKRNILTQCIEEIISLDTENRTCFHGRDGFVCEDRTQCARYSF